MSEEKKAQTEEKKAAPPRIEPPKVEPQKIQVENSMVEEIKKFLGEDLIEGKVQRPRRIYLKVKPGAHRKAIQYMKDNWGLYHISTISGLDLGNNLEVVFHLNARNIEVNLRAEIPRNKAKIDTITDLLPGSNLYEREVHDLFGIEFRGHPNLEKLELPEDWPKGVYPLRKDWKVPE
nr:NADH-quinone oxidoreductase subunit C [Candidatus Njordarchaeota archaeon]